MADKLGEMRRTHSCGQLGSGDVGRDVVLMGWVLRRSDHAGVIFVDLRDREGITQVVFNPEQAPAAHATAEAIRSEFVLGVRGQVRNRSFGRALSDFDPQKGKACVEEARRYQEDIRKIVEQTIALTPVQKVLDGTFRSYSPGCCYYRRSDPSWGWVGSHYGLEEQFHLTGLQGSPTLGSLHDPRHDGHLEVFQDRFIFARYSMKVLERGFFAARKKKGLTAEENWFWGGISIQPGWFWGADEELYRDDVPNFLRFLVDTYWHATAPGDGEYHLQEVGTDHNWTAGGWNRNTNSMGWFIRNFRNLLVMEDVDAEPWRLWLARATPRHWLEQGKKISVKNAPGGEHKSIRLGKCSQSQADAVKVKVERLVAAKLTGTMDDENARWVGQLDAVMHGKLAAVGLVEGEARL